MAKAKITVIKKLNLKDLYVDKPPAAYDEGRITPECNRFEVGQEFVVDSHKCPPGFCNWAYADIQRDLVHILFTGATIPWMKEKGVSISCCTDGFRPVIFKLERIED
jgi:uncharacterized repeat protein (TIGR04076 family)